MFTAAKYIGAGFACSGLVDATFDMDLIFFSLILFTLKNNLIITLKTWLKTVSKFMIKLNRKFILLVDKLPEPEYKVTKLFEVMDINQNQNTLKTEITLFNSTGIKGEEFFYTLMYTLNSIPEWSNVANKVILINFINPQTLENFYITPPPPPCVPGRKIFCYKKRDYSLWRLF